MTLEAGPTRSASLADRVKSILLQPGVTWTQIDREPATVGGLFKGYALILAAIGPICHAIGMVVFGVGVPGIAMYHAGPVGALLTAVVSYGLSLLSVFVLGLIIDALAPTFGGQKNQVQAMKVAVYGSTAAWLAGAFGIVPMLAILGIVGLYSLFLVYRGLPILMKTTVDKAMGYTALVVVCDIVLFLLIAAVTAPLAMVGTIGAAGGLSTIRSTAGSTVQLGGAAVDLGKLQAASAQMQAQAAAMQAAASGAAATPGSAAAAAGVAPAVLQAMLPVTIGGFVRGDISSESSGAAGISASHAQARYARGDAHMDVEITDMAAMGGIAGLASAFNVNSSKQTATGYEKVSTQAGRMTTEEFDSAAKHGKYSVMAGSRFMIAAEGDNVTMDDLKGAVSAVGVERVEHLAHS